MGPSTSRRAEHGSIGRLVASLTFLIGASGSPVAAQPTIATYVGTSEVIAVAADSQGNIYFATDRPGAIFKKNGLTGQVRLVAGKPGGSTADGERAVNAAVFPGRNGLAVDSTDSIFFSEPSTHHIRRIDAESGRVSTVAGTWSGFSHDPRNIDGSPAASADFAAPGALAFNPATGDLFVADEIWDIVYRISTNGNGPIDASLNAFAYLAVGGNPSSPSIYVDSLWYNPFGYAGDGGPAIDAKLNHPRGLAFDAAENLYIADTGNNVVRRVDAAGTITRFAGTSTPGSGGDGGAAAAAQLFMPAGVAVDAFGNLLIADTANHRVRFVAAGSTVITTLAGNGVPGHAGDGSAATGASLAYPLGVAVDRAGQRLIVDSQNNRLRFVALDGTISTIFAGGSDYAGDGVTGGNAVNQPQGLAIDHAGNVFFADSGNSRVRRVDAQTQTITTVAGNGIPGNEGDHGVATAARLNCPAGLLVGQTGHLFIADPCANVVRRVEAGADGLIKGAADEIITTYAGNGIRYGLSDGDGGSATQASLNAPLSLAMDNAGNLFIGEDDIGSIREVDSATGSITTPATNVGSRGMGFDSANHWMIADNLNGGFYCDLQSLQVNDFTGLSDDSYSGFAFGGLGTFYVGQDRGFHSVLQFAPVSGSLCSGVFAAARLAGAGSLGYTGDNGPAADARLNHPSGLVAAAGGVLFIADSGNNVIRRVLQSAVGPALDVNPTTIDFGTQTQGVATAPTPLTVTNSTSAPLTVLSLSFTGANVADFATSSDTCSGTILAAQAFCTVGVIFTPQGVGSRASTLNVHSTAVDSPRTVSVAGIGFAAVPDAVAAPPSVVFDSVVVGMSSGGVSVTLTSAGTAPLSVTSVVLSGNQPGDFALSSDTCTSRLLAPGQFCTVSVKFAPQEMCGATALLLFTDNAAGAPQAVTLSGVGVAGATAQFQSTLYCTSRGAQPQDLTVGADGRVWFEELGSVFAPPAIGTVSTETGVQEQPGAVQDQWAPYELTFAPDGRYAYVEARGPGFPIWLDIVSQSGLKTQYPIVGVAGPLGVGPDGAFWYAAEHTCPGSGGVPLVTRYASGQAPVSYTPTLQWLAANTNNHFCAATSLVTAGPDGTVWIGLRDTTGGSASSAAGFLRVSTSGVFIDFLPTVGFPTAATAAPDGNLYALVGNTNSCRLERFDPLGAVTTVPLGASVFLSCRSITAGPDGRLWMIGSVFNGAAFVVSMIGIDPISGAVHAYPAPATAFLTAGADQGIWFNSLPSAVGRFDLGGGPARAFVSPKIVGFPATAIGVPSGARTVTVRSTGSGPLTISGVFLGGADPGQFVLSDGCVGAVLPPGTSCEVLVASRPTHNGSHSATLIVNGDDMFSPQIVRLEMFTLPAPPVVTPASVAFPTTLVGQHSATARLTLTNPAAKALNVSSVTLSGPNSSDFAIVADLCSGTSVPGGGTCTVTVRFAPTVAGAGTAIVTFTDSANPPTQSVSLTGGGQTAPGTDPCACSTTGLFVDPVVVAPKAAATSPKGLFRLTVAPGGPNGGPSLLTITTASGAPVMTFTPRADATWPVKSPWGFSPDGKRFAVHFQSMGEDWIELFDLTGAQPATAVRSLHLPIAPGSTVTSPAGSMAFSPHGDYFVTAQLQTPAASLNQTVVLNLVSASGTVLKTTSWSPARTPAAPHTKVDSAFWGFSPDDQSFTFIKLDPTGIPSLTLLSLPSGDVVQHLTFTNSLATFVRFAPCSDVLGLVNQATHPILVTPPNPVSITLYSTKADDAGAPAVGSVSNLPVAGTQLVAGPTQYTAQLVGWPNTVNLAANSAAAGCPAPGTSGTAGGSATPDPTRARASTFVGSASGGLSSQTVLMLPNGRGEIHLAADVTPAVSIFHYLETDAPSGPLGNLIFGGLDFTFVGTDAASGAPVSAFADAPRATLVFREDEMRAARVRDISTLGLYLWSGTAWVNQLPCAGCGVDADAGTLTVSLTQPGEYVLAAAPQPTPLLTIVPASIQATAGVVFAGTVATFLPDTALDILNQYAAIITWGDGQLSQGMLSVSDEGTFSVSGTHAWATSGSFPVALTILDNGVSFVVQTTAVVAPAQAAPLFTAAAPPLTATQGVPYTYSFAASGTPVPTFALASGAPAWLSIGATTGLVSGTPPTGTTSFVYGVAASNGVSPNASTGPFVVAVSPANDLSADLSIQLTGPAVTWKGSTVTYTAVVTNRGRSTAHNVFVVPAVGPGACYVATAPPIVHIAPGLWIWSVEALAPGQSARFTFRVKLTRRGTVFAIAATGSETHDSAVANNLSAVRTIVR